MQTYFYEGPVCDLCKKIASACDCTARQNTKESSGTDKQHLQAKIRAIADKLFVCHFQSGSGGLDNLALINELRELSAMQ